MEIRGKKGEIYLVKGECDVIVKSGVIESVGARIPAGEGFVIPLGKTIPIEFIEDSLLKIESDDLSDKIQKLNKSTIPESWHKLINIIKTEKKKRIIILGEVDTGKSFFTTYISNQLYNDGYKVGVIDCDIGQSDVGAPGTMGLTYITRPTLFLPHSPVAEMYFIGSHSANLHFLPAIIGFNFLLRKAEKNADVVIVNTSGWVHGDGGRAYKRAKLEIMAPDIIVLLQRGDELEHLVKVYPADKVYRIGVSKKATFTPPEERKALREMVMAQYLMEGREVELGFDEIETERVFFKTGKEVPPPHEKVIYAEKLPGWEGILLVVKERFTLDEFMELKKQYGNIKVVEPEKLKYIYVAVTDQNHHFLGLGTVLDIDFNRRKIKLFTTAKNGRIKIIQFGSLKIKPDGTEAGFIEPGYF